MAPKNHAKPVKDMFPKEGMTLLAFLGRGSNARPFYGEGGRRYLFGGRHHTIEYVLKSDVAYMLEMKEGGRTLFEVVKLAKPAQVETPVIEPIHTDEELDKLMDTEPVVEKPVKKSRKKKVKPDA